MFDIGFWELSIIGVVALIVIGPERLPSVARTAGLWFGRMRGFVSTMKADIDKQLKAEDLQKILKEQADSAGLHEIIEETKETVDSLSQPADYLVKSDSNDAAAAETSTDSGEEKQQDNDSKS
ncbi:MAG: Sec-independent protein translocase protein TatB [Pseudomonadota bacterium]